MQRRRLPGKCVQRRPVPGVAGLLGRGVGSGEMCRMSQSVVRRIGLEECFARYVSDILKYWSHSSVCAGLTFPGVFNSICTFQFMIESKASGELFCISLKTSEYFLLVF